MSIYRKDVSDLVEAWADSTSFSIQSTLRFQCQFCPTKEDAPSATIPYANARVAKCHSLNMSCSLKTCGCATGRSAAKLPKLTCKVQPWLFADALGECLRISQSNGISCRRGGDLLATLRAKCCAIRQTRSPRHGHDTRSHTARKVSYSLQLTRRHQKKHEG